MPCDHVYTVRFPSFLCGPVALLSCCASHRSHPRGSPCEGVVGCGGVWGGGGAAALMPTGGAEFLLL